MNSRIIKILKTAALSAGKAVIKSKPSEGVVNKEGRANITTAADLASEKAIVNVIKSNFPNDPIFSEETKNTMKSLLSFKKLWVIDPIDGTNNFRHERNYSSISIGYTEKGVIQAGVVYDPFRKELFYAQKEEGAFLNDQKISVSNEADLSHATVATDNSYDPSGTKYNLKQILKISPTPWVLIKGSAVLTMCEVACGRIDLYFHNYLKPWDNAAAFLIAEEAGGNVIDINGRETNFLSNSVIIGNKKLVKQFLSALKELK